MADSLPLNPNPTSPPSPTQNLATTPQTCAPPAPPPSPFLRRPPIRATTEFDSESNLFFHKLSCKLVDGLAKLKFSCQSDREGQLERPQIGFITKHLKVFYDVESRNALLNGSMDVGQSVQLRGTHDVKCGEIGALDYIHIGSSILDSLSISCAYKYNNSILACLNIPNLFSLKYHFFKEKAGEISMITNLGDPLYKLELSSLVPVAGLPRATVKFPLGEVSLEQAIVNEETEEKALSVSGIVRTNVLDGIGTAMFTNNDLNLRYCYKDKEMTFVPSLYLPTNAASFAFKRRFTPSDKLSYMYHFDSSDWSAVYKHNIEKDLKFKAGYDSSKEGGLRWASIWIGDEDGGAKRSPMKMKFKFMLQVPQDINQSVFLFHVKKRWDF